MAWEKTFEINSTALLNLGMRRVFESCWNIGTGTCQVFVPAVKIVIGGSIATGGILFVYRG